MQNIKKQRFENGANAMAPFSFYLSDSANRKKWLTSLTKLNILNALIELDKANPRALGIYNYFPEKAGRRFP